MMKYLSFALLAVVCIASWGGKADSGSRYDVGDIIDIPLSKHEIELEPRKGRVQQILKGHFIDLSVEHTVIYGGIVDEDEIVHENWHPNVKFMQFENGPIMDDIYDLRREAITTCQHPKSGLTYLVDIRHGGGTIDGDAGYVYFIGVNAETHELEVAYSEYAEHGPYNDKICGWVAKKEKLSIFSDAMKALRIEDDKIWPNGTDEDSIYVSISQMKAGNTMQLPWRSIPVKVVQGLLKKLDDVATDIIINGKVHPALVEIDNEYIDDWHIIQITGTEICGGKRSQGVVLVKHAPWKSWRAIYNIESGCSKVINYPLLQEDENESITSENSMLQVNMYYEFTHWGESRYVAIDLHTNVITAK